MKQINGIIYVAENTVNGKRYVGQTVQGLEKRQAHHKKDSEVCDFKFYRAVQKYGWDSFTWAVIVEGIENIDSLNSLEKYWIKELDTFENGYNSTTGGEGHLVTEETKRKISESQKGEKAHSWGKTGIKHPRSKPVLQLDILTGEVIAEFAGIKEAERVTGIHDSNISKNCRGKRKSAGGYYWQYKE